MASQPLSTLEANGWTGLPFSGQVVSLAPVAGSYQLKNMPEGSCRSSPATVRMVRFIRCRASAAPISPVSRATTVAQR